MRGRFYILGLSVFSLAFQPLAYGQQQANWASQALKSYVQQNQKGGKTITVKEFWEKNAKNFDPYWQKKFYPSIEVQKDQRLPKMEVINIKGPNGKDSARLMMNVNGKTVSVEYLGGSEKFLRVNSTVISYADFLYVNPMLEKLSKDPVIAAETKRVEKLALKESIVPSYETFKKMSARTRAAYFVNLRLLLEASQKVLEQADAKAKERAYYEPSFIDLILEKAYAQGGIKGRPCIVQGYVGKWTGKNKNDTYCAHEVGLNQAQRDTVNQTNVQKWIGGACSKGSSPCNPFVFGIPDEPCISHQESRKDKNSDFQRATSVCDGRMPLRTNDRKTLAADTQKMIETLLAKEKNESLEKVRSEYFKDGKVISKEKFDELQKSIVADFNQFISAGIATCEATADGKQTPDQHQGSACEVLRTRKLAFEQGMKELEFVPPAPTPEPEPAPVATEPPPAPAPVDPCGPLLAAGKATNEAIADGKKVNCTPVAAPLPAETSRGAPREPAKEKERNWLPIAIFVGVGALLFSLFKRKPKQPKLADPVPADPIVAPPLPPPPEPPAEPTPIPPITPIETPTTPVTPVTPPGSTETNPGAPTYDPGAGGTQR